MPLRLRVPHGAALAASALVLTAAHAQAPTAARPALAPAPYVAPAIGTRYVYSTFAQTITANAGLRTGFLDHRQAAGARLALFIPDSPVSPLAVDTVALARLWPLRLGHEVRVPTGRGERRWDWLVRVVDTERVTVPAGTFDTYVVEAIEVATRTPNPTSTLKVTTFWYAPATNAVVRFTMGTRGVTNTRITRQELQRIERAGPAAPRAAAD